MFNPAYDHNKLKFELDWNLESYNSTLYKDCVAVGGLYFRASLVAELYRALNNTIKNLN
jgi:hypothetical protein